MSRALAGLVLMLALMLAGGAARAFSADTPLDDPALEARALALHDGLRCMVCRGQSIAGSNAELARDMRTIVREHLAAGESDAAVLKFLTDRYGDFVLLRPPVKPITYALWFGPALVLVLGAGAIFLLLRRGRARTRNVQTLALSADEQRRLDALLDDREP